MGAAADPLSRSGRQGLAAAGSAVEYPSSLRQDLGGLHDHLSPDGPGIRSVAPRARRRVEDNGGHYSSGGLIPTSTSNGGGNAQRPPTLGKILNPASSRGEVTNDELARGSRDITQTDGVAVSVWVMRSDDAPLCKGFAGDLASSRSTCASSVI